MGDVTVMGGVEGADAKDSRLEAGTSLTCSAWNSVSAFDRSSSCK